MRQTLNTWMTESAKEVLRGDSGERRFRNGENGVFFCFFRLGSQIFPSGFKGIWGWKFPNQEFVNDFLRWPCFSSAGQGKSVLSRSVLKRKFRVFLHFVVLMYHVFASKSSSFAWQPFWQCCARCKP